MNPTDAATLNRPPPRPPPRRLRHAMLWAALLALLGVPTLNCESTRAQDAARLFTPSFTTRAECMGLGLSLCRTVIEQHGGVLDFGPGPGGRGTEFRFTLPAPKVAETGETSGSTNAA